MIVDWLNSWDRSKSIDWNQAQLTNWYLVPNQRGKLPLAAFPTPGTSLFADIGGSVCRGGFVYNEVLYVVIDNKFYKVNNLGVATLISTISTSTGHLGVNKWAKITNQIIFIDGVEGYHYDTSTSTFTIIADADFPSNTTSITAQDDYFLVNNPGTPIVTYSDISDGLSWNALNIFQKNRVAENVMALAAMHGLIYVMGATSIEPFFNSGAPFEREQNSLLYIGTEYTETWCIASDASGYFLARQAGGGYTIVQTRQDQFLTISNSIDYDLSQLTTVSDAFAYIYKQEGNEFYQITFPTDKKTFVYQINTQSWHARESFVNAEYTRHISNFVVSCYGKIIIGDFSSGKLYSLSTTNYTENDVPIRRTLVTYPFFSEDKYIIGNRLIIIFETGVGTDSEVDIQFSKDNGHTYTSFIPTRSVGATPGARNLIYNRLGSARQWSFKAQTTMTDKCIMIGAIGNFTIGVN